MKNPTVIVPQDFDMQAAAGADPSVVSCPACKEYYWAWGQVHRCECGFEYPVDWWPRYSEGCRDGRLVSKGAKLTGGIRRRLDAHPYYAHGFETHPENPFDARDEVDWPKIVAGLTCKPLGRTMFCERCGEDKTGRRQRSTQLCVPCEAQTSCRHERPSPISLTEPCSAGVTLGDLIENKPGWALRVPCRFMSGGRPVACDKFEPVTVEECERHDEEMEQSLARTFAAMSVVPGIKEEYKGRDWRGTKPCPVCGGVLHLSHSGYNGHVHGKCETEGCVSWME